MWHIENRSGEFENMYVKWFGGDATLTDDRYVRLRDGFVKICSIQGYNYHCDPESVTADSCPFSATLLDGTTYAEDTCTSHPESFIKVSPPAKFRFFTGEAIIKLLDSFQ